MGAASALIPGSVWLGACVLALGWGLVGALLAVFLWQISYANKFHKGRLDESFETLDAAQNPSATPPIIPSKGDVSVAQQLLYTPPAPPPPTLTLPTPSPPHR
jgi:hypothetical protein